MERANVQIVTNQQKTEELLEKFGSLSEEYISKRKEASQELMEQIAKIRRQIDVQLESYVSIRKLREELFLVEDKIGKVENHAGNTYDKKSDVDEKVKKLQKLVSSEYCLKRQLNDVDKNQKIRFDANDTKLQALAEKIEKHNEHFKHVSNAIETKADKKALAEVKNEHTRFALYSDLKDLHTKVIPIVS